MNFKFILPGLRYVPVLCSRPSNTFSNSQYSTSRNEKHGPFQQSTDRKLGILIIGSICIYSYYRYNHRTIDCLEENRKYGRFKKTLPSYTLREVGQHSEEKTRIWVTYQEGVYDITDFVNIHPGSSNILLAAGGSVEPFWAIYGFHKSEDILCMLEKYRIGNLCPDEVDIDVSDPYSTDPVRHPILKPSSVKPFNAEPPPKLLVESYVTPNEFFYVRNHLPVPVINPKDYKLEISGIGTKDKTFTLDDIKSKFKKYTITATVQCAGNRRSEMVKVKPVKGLNWGQAAIGNATWSGARLIDVLKYCGLTEKHSFEHVQFEGLDTDPASFPYGASIPMEKVLDPRGDVLLAYEMNGEPIPIDHGFPIRVIVPGVVGARNVKWLGRIILSKEESKAHWQQNDYKGFSPSVDWDTVDFKSAPAIQELPVISAICEPENGSTVQIEDGCIKVKGYAWSGGGRRIVRVDVTPDQGKTWHVAKLNQNDDKHPHHWGWTLWTANIPIEKAAKKVEIWAKATDSSYNTQPESFENIWNLRGVLSNAYHRININLKR